ncbi:TPA: MFS transporter [Bacillus cereus]|uniref:MFS transporter n=1 Tax=Bacillus TaxID=1386 RepID=UPI000BF6E011|nr:MFS transporter [Bacillus thuringiensis]PFU70322.1 hypothetical protein COK95_09440 [Bacillus thuringiensis]RAS89390.1 hypothetical protein A6E21_27160 [Bacillus cereus]HDR8128715.1 MFS transporter [Bacillus cereus]HDR8493510.1 MFS transporter [Bacillus cereus]
MEIFKSRNSFLFILATGITSIGDGMYFIGLSWLGYSLTGSAGSVAVIVALGTLPGLIASPFSGVVADRFNRKLIIISMDIFRAIVCLFIPAIMLFGDLKIWHLYIVAITLTLGSNFFHPALSGLTKSSIPKNLIIRVISANATLLQLGMIIGSGLSGFIISQTSVEYIFYVNALTYSISALLFAFMKYEYIKKDSTHKNIYQQFFSDFKEGLNYIFNNKFLVHVFIIGFFPGIAIHVLNSLLSAYTKESLHLGVKEYGLLDSSYALGAVFMGLCISIINKKFTRKNAITYSSLLFMFSFLIIGSAPNFFIAVIGLFLLGLTVMLEGVNRRGLLIEYVDNDYIGRVQSLNWTVYSSLAPTFAIITGFLSDHFGNRQVFFLLAIIAMLVFLYAKKSLQLPSSIEIKKDTYNQ